MGVYDSVMVNCPQCGTSHEFQSKSGDVPFCRVFTLEECPEDVLEDVNRHAPCECDCGASFEVDLANRVAIVVNTSTTTPFVNRGTLVVSYEKVEGINHTDTVKALLAKEFLFLYSAPHESDEDLVEMLGELEDIHYELIETGDRYDTYYTIIEIDGVLIGFEWLVPHGDYSTSDLYGEFNWSEVHILEK